MFVKKRVVQDFFILEMGFSLVDYYSEVIDVSMFL